MAFKEDWSFLDKISMGAVGTKCVIRQLNNMGHNVIELERYCTSNKIWATKIKRLRIPDLLCLRCGKRIESRAKSKLGIIMSDAENNPERRWFAGLRETDIVAFIQCFKDINDLWQTNGIINLFAVSDLLRTEDQTTLSAPKSVNEGAERDRTWKSYTPSINFIVSDIRHDGNVTQLCLMNNDAGRNQSRKLNENEYLYVSADDSFPANSKIVCGIVPRTIDCTCSHTQYNFFTDLTSEIIETVYTAVKALGYLGNNPRAISELRRIAESVEKDPRIRLEAYASLLKIGQNVWQETENFAMAANSKEIEMEYVLILGEIESELSTEALMRVVRNETLQPELRAAAIWSLHSNPQNIRRIIEYCFVTEEVISNHAIVKVENNFSSELTVDILECFGEDETRNAVCARLLSSCPRIDYNLIVRRYLDEENIQIKNWILFAIGLSGRNAFERTIIEMDHHYEQTFEKLSLLWDYKIRYLSDDLIDKIEFIKRQK